MSTHVESCLPPSIGCGPFSVFYGWQPGAKRGFLAVDLGVDLAVDRMSTGVDSGDVSRQLA